MSDQGAILIVGASARAAALSAARAGWPVAAVDLFRDADLRAVCCAHDSVEKHGSWAAAVGFLASRASCPISGWMYTGGMENRPRQLDAIACRLPLWGNRGEPLRRVRSLRWLDRVAQSAGCPMPPWQTAPDGIPQDGSWLVKPIRGSGGMRIRPWRGEPRQKGEPPRYYQKRVDGQANSAVFLAAGGSAVLLGPTEQWLGFGALPDRPLAYRGSIGPIEVEPAVRQRIAELGSQVARESEIAGLFGIDFVVDGQLVWTIEVNPRYPASAEILEPWLITPAVALHVAACCEGRLPRGGLVRGGGWAAKEIVIAPAPLLVSASLTQRLLGQRGSGPLPHVADIPAPGTRIPTGAPIATVLAVADTRAEAENLIVQRRAALLRRCYPEGNADPAARSA